MSRNRPTTGPFISTATCEVHREAAQKHFGEDSHVGVLTELFYYLLHVRQIGIYIFPYYICLTDSDLHMLYFTLESV